MKKGVRLKLRLSTDLAGQLPVTTAASVLAGRLGAAAPVAGRPPREVPVGTVAVRTQPVAVALPGAALLAPGALVAPRRTLVHARAGASGLCCRSKCPAHPSRLIGSGSGGWICNGVVSVAGQKREVSAGAGRVSAPRRRRSVTHLSLGRLGQRNPSGASH